MARWLNANLTVSLPEDEYERIKKHPEVKWGSVARKALIWYLEELEKMKSNASDKFKIVFEDNK